VFSVSASTTQREEELPGSSRDPQLLSSAEIARTVQRGRPDRCLFVQYTAEVSGSTVSGHMIAKALIDSDWCVDVAFGVSGPFCCKYEEIGCTSHVVPHGQWLVGGNLWRSCRCWYREGLAMCRFIRLMRRVRPKLVYVNTIMGVAAVAAARILRIPSIWHIRELFDDVGGEMIPPSLGGRYLVRNVIRRLPDRVIAISRAVVDNIVGDRATRNVHVVPNAVASAFFEENCPQRECRTRLKVPCEGPLIGVPGTLRPVKGHAFFLDAAAIVARKCPDCNFAITGDGTSRFREELQEKVGRLAIEHRVHFVGTVPDMRCFYRACDLVCVPSRSESFGRTVIEAFAAGVPVVASAVGGICETVDHEATGLLVPFGDVEGLTRQLVRLLEDRPLRETLAARAQQKARACYSETVHVDRIRSVVEEVARVDTDPRAMVAKHIVSRSDRRRGRQE